MLTASYLMQTDLKYIDKIAPFSFSLLTECFGMANKSLNLGNENPKHDARNVNSKDAKTEK